MKYSVNEEGIQSLRAMACSSLKAIDKILELVSEIKLISDNYEELLGPHKASLNAELFDITHQLRHITGTVSEMSKTLNEVAEGYEEILENDKIQKAFVCQPSFEEKTASKSKGLFSKIFSKDTNNKDNEKTISFGEGLIAVKDSLNTDRYFICGNQHDKFKDYWENMSEKYAEEYCEEPQIEFICAKDIEGIPLGEGDIKNPERFWGRWEGGTQKTFEKIARQIPEVKMLLDAGKSCDEIAADRPELENCVDIYFRNPREVSKADGFYVFKDNGRHRELAAQAVNGMIPVKVTSVIKWKQ